MKPLPTYDFLKNDILYAQILKYEMFNCPEPYYPEYWQVCKWAVLNTSKATITKGEGSK